MERAAAPLRRSLLLHVPLLRAERDRLSAELAEIENRTRRLSDSYLDLDLLDQQAREILGYVRSDEIVLR